MEANLHCLNHFDAYEGLQHCVRCGRVFCNDCLVFLQGAPYCASCKNEQALDIASGVDVSVGNLAHVGRRFVALIIDSVVVGVPVQMLSMVLQAGAAFFKNIAVQMAALGGILLFSIMANVAYEALMLLMRNGQTIGKMAMQIRVVRVGGAPLSPKEAWLRPVVRFVTAAMCAADYIAVFFTAEKTAIHDMAAGTRVVNA